MSPDTKQWIKTERELHPLALGPYIGALAVELNMPSQLLAKLLGAHEQTVHRWITRRSAIVPTRMAKVVKGLSLLCWMHDTKCRPLVGRIGQQEKQLAVAIEAFLAASSTAQKTKHKV